MRVMSGAAFFAAGRIVGFLGNAVSPSVTVLKMRTKWLIHQQRRCIAGKWQFRQANVWSDMQYQYRYKVEHNFGDRWFTTAWYEGMWLFG
jgi:hypothetical protein